MQVRAKFVCGFKDEQAKSVYLNPVYTGSDENERFFRSTPGGQIILNIVNPAAFDRFVQGREYYVDFTEADLVAKPAAT